MFPGRQYSPLLSCWQSARKDADTPATLLERGISNQPVPGAEGKGEERRIMVLKPETASVLPGTCVMIFQLTLLFALHIFHKACLIP